MWWGLKMMTIPNNNSYKQFQNQGQKMQEINTYTYQDVNQLRSILKITQNDFDEILRKHPPFLEKYPNSLLYQQFRQFKIENFCSIRDVELVFGWSYLVNPEDEDNQETKDFQEIINFLNEQIIKVFELKTFFEDNTRFHFANKLIQARIKDHLFRSNETYKTLYRFDVLEIVNWIFNGRLLTPVTYNAITNELIQLNTAREAACERSKVPDVSVLTDEEALALLPSGNMFLQQVGNTVDHLDTQCTDDRVYWFKHIRPLLLAIEQKVIEKLNNKET